MVRSILNTDSLLNCARAGRSARMALLSAFLMACGGVAGMETPCLDGSLAADGRCSTRIVCSTGTKEESGACVPVGKSCGAGTVAQGDQCVPLALSPYEVRTISKRFPADGRTKVPVFAIGQEPDGTPSLRDVFFGPSRGDVGSIVPARRTLTATGVTSYFVPCNATLSPTCLGPFQIQLALAEAPTSIVARSWDIEMVEQGGVGLSDACMLGGNAVFFDGDSGDWIHPGLDLVTRGQWSGTPTPGSLPDTVRISPYVQCVSRQVGFQ